MRHSSLTPPGSENPSRNRSLKTKNKTDAVRKSCKPSGRDVKASSLAIGTLPTLDDIAERVGVSRATVSMGLRDNTEISAATRQRIKTAARELGYRPDPMLSALSARRRHGRVRANLALLVDDCWRDKQANPEGTDWLDEIVRGMRAGAERHGYTLTELLINKHLRAWRHPDRVLTARGMAGLFLLPLNAPDAKLPELDWSHYSVVAVGVPPGTARWHRAGADAYGTMHMICEHLRARGVRRVGLARQLDTITRMRGEWLGALSKEWFLPDQAMEIVLPYLPPEMNQKSFTEWFLREKPEVVVTYERKVVEWIETTGARVPEDAGMVMLSSGRHMPGGETGIVQDIDQVGEGAVDLMHGLILRGEKGAPSTAGRELLVSARWVEGATLRK